MSCRECGKKNDNYFKKLGKATGNPYGKYEDNGQVKYIPQKDFHQAKEKGFIGKEIEIEVL